MNELFPEKLKQYREIKEQIFNLMKEADKLAIEIKKAEMNFRKKHNSLKKIL